jgi:hypothetical protein
MLELWQKAREGQRMITFEDLVAKFPLKNVAPFGESVVVPGKEFDPDWEAELGDQGCKFHFVELGGEQVTLVQKSKKSEASEERMVYEPPATEKNHEVATVDNVEKQVHSDFPWSDEDEQKMLEVS